MAGRAQGWRGLGLPGLGGVGTHGLRYSQQLLSVCFRPMMMAICRNRSIMQPLAWHCGAREEGSGGVLGGQGGRSTMQLLAWDCGARRGRGSGRGPGGQSGEQWPEAWG